MQYKEKPSVGDSYRRNYLDQLDAFILKMQQQATANRMAFAKNIVENTEHYRKQFKEMLGFPLNLPRNGIPNVQKSLVAQEGSIKIYRITTEIFENFSVYGLLFTQDENTQKPLVICAHGGQGTPEICSTMFEDGSYNYNDMTERVLKQDVHVYAPQFLLWSTEKYPIWGKNDKPDIDYVRRTRDYQLKQLGSSITAIEIYGIQRVLDYLEQEPYVNADQIGMTGLSYGGFYTLFTTAAETRIKSALACAQFNNRFTYNWSDWTWQNSGNTFLDAEVLALICPRPIQIFVGDTDELFDANAAKAEFERFKQIAGDKADYAAFEIFKGGHEYIQWDVPIERLVYTLKNL